MTKVLLQCLFYSVADLWYHYKSLSVADRNRINKTPLSGLVLCDNSLELIDLKNVNKKSVIFDTTTFCNLYLILTADPCYNYQNLSDANRKSSYVTPMHGPSLCDKPLFEGWYRFVGAAGTKMPTTSVSAHRCGTYRSGWLNGAHPTVEDGEVRRTVCFDPKPIRCRYLTYILVKNCGSYFIYKLQKPSSCPLRYCSTDWM